MKWNNMKEKHTKHKHFGSVRYSKNVNRLNAVLQQTKQKNEPKTK